MSASSCCVVSALVFPTLSDTQDVRSAPPPGFGGFARAAGYRCFNGFTSNPNSQVIPRIKF